MAANIDEVREWAKKHGERATSMKLWNGVGKEAHG
jgi:hypothetical protein